MGPSGMMCRSRRFARRRNSIGRRTSGSDVCVLREVGKCTPLLRPSHSGRPLVQVVQLCGLAGQDISAEESADFLLTYVKIRQDFRDYLCLGTQLSWELSLCRGVFVCYCFAAKICVLYR